MLLRLIVSVLSSLLFYQHSYGSNLKEISFALDSPYIYSWLQSNSSDLNTVEKRIPTPTGFKRVPVANNSFEAWLRNLPLKEKGSKVMLYNGEPKYRQDVHEAVVDIDIGKTDLQQCADAVMRLRAEYLYATKQYNQISFNFTNGQAISYSEWRKGNKIVFKNNKAVWVPDSIDKTGYQSFKKYYNLIFAYAGTYSLSQELESVSNLKDIKAGDVFIYGGFPGHAVIVIDVVQNQKGEKYFLIAQSYMPAQSIHILKNNANPDLSPWYSLSEIKREMKIYTPEWTFEVSDLKRFK
ncbi:DUF4846 domain-containing protein [Chondrinema litorale]|uniref:DUF4846 domain-containing protein n=1 Tax=Chondrinema litorale TaxID=2994555 RepID=UPI00254350D3|nr:DUF4846 domain-containing protein [Chondrinema litorale]UZR93496.1 DUF4846 domain-containing protein [Chondrinema litorale]